MHTQVDNIRKTRSYLLQAIEGLSIAELNEIPAGFNNNIIWNIGHLIAAQQGICYLRAGMQPKVPEALIAAYRPGTKPEGFVDEAAFAQIRALLFSTLDELEQDYAAGLWPTYTPWSTRYGVELNSIDSAINFLQFHEGLHSGYIMALRRVVHGASVNA